VREAVANSNGAGAPPLNQPHTEPPPKPRAPSLRSFIAQGWDTTTLPNPNRSHPARPQIPRAPSLRCFCFYRKGGIPQPSPSPVRTHHKSVILSDRSVAQGVEGPAVAFRKADLHQPFAVLKGRGSGHPLGSAPPAPPKRIVGFTGCGKSPNRVTFSPQGFDLRQRCQGRSKREPVWRSDREPVVGTV
jgi:hypothetical protein